jgi:hypothetical protein
MELRIEVADDFNYTDYGHRRTHSDTALSILVDT